MLSVTSYEFKKPQNAFQLQDDVWMCMATKPNLKQKGGDIIANKKTYLLVKAMETAKGYIDEELGNWIFAPTFEPKDKIAARNGHITVSM